MANFKQLFVFVAVFLAVQATAVQMARSAPITDHATDQEIVRGLGATETIDWSKKPTAIEITVDEDAVIAAIPTLQQSGILNPDLDQTFINTHPTSLALSVATQAAIMEIMDAYTNSGIDRAKFRVTLAVADEYGNKKSHDAFSFQFNRALFKRINWDNFQTQNLLKIAPDFRYTEWAMQNVEGL